MSNHQSILEVVRGIKPWQVLKKIGVQRHGNTWTFTPHINDVLIIMNDLITGFKNSIHDPKVLQEWATFMLVGPIDFGDLETDPRFDDIVGALWDISFGEDVDWKNLKDLMDL